MTTRNRRDGKANGMTVVISNTGGVVTTGTVARRPAPITKTKRKQVVS